MDSTVITGIILAVVQTAITTIVGTVLGLIIKNKWEKAKKEREELDKLKEEKRAAGETKRCEIVKQAVHEEVEQLESKVKNEFVQLRSDFNGELKTICEDTDIMKKAMQKDIRRSIRQDGKLLIDRGYATQLEKTEFDELYWAYHNLGKNGVVDALHEEVMHLPERKPRARRTKKQILVENK